MSNTTYRVSKYPREDQNCKGNEGITKPTGVHLRKLEQSYMREQRYLEENHLAQPPPQLINNVHFCYDRDSPINYDNKKRQHFLQHEGKYRNTKKLTNLDQ